jgi:hypothetical protein
MSPQQETALKYHLRTLDTSDLENLKAHAEAVDHENHPSAKTLLKWVGGIVGSVTAGGAIWKIVKVIKNH